MEVHGGNHRFRVLQQRNEEGMLRQRVEIDRSTVSVSTDRGDDCAGRCITKNAVTSCVLMDVPVTCHWIQDSKGRYGRFRV